MTIKTWNGDTAPFSTAADWSPGGVPVAGDDATISAGTVSYTGVFASGLILRINSTARDSPTLAVTNGLIAAGSLFGVYGGTTSSTVQVSGSLTNQGVIAVGSTGAGSATFLLAPVAGGGASTLVNSGTIGVLDGALQLLNFGTGANQVVNNGIIMLAASSVVAQASYIGTAVSGTGSIRIGAGRALEILGAVSSGQAVALEGAGASGSSLLLDAPSAFQAMISGFVSGDRLVLGGGPTGLTYTRTTATSGVLSVAHNGSTFANIKMSGVYTTSDFSVGSDAVSIRTSATTPVFGYTDTVTHVSGGVSPDLYSGPVNYLQWQYIWNSNDDVAIAANRDNVFLHGGVGADALSVQGGSNVLDGGAGSNFLVGAAGADGGADTFYVDGRGGAVTWSSIVNFHHNDAVTIFGFNDNSTLPAFTMDGADGYTGATIHSELGGAGTGVNGSMTLVGLSVADAQSKLTVQTGHFGTAGQADYLGYLYIAYTG